MAFGVSKDPGRLISGILLALCGIGQITGTVKFELGWTLAVAGFLFIMEAANW